LCCLLISILLLFASFFLSTEALLFQAIVLCIVTLAVGCGFSPR
jgi:hypothetical protein